MISWDSLDNHVLLNPRFPFDERIRLLTIQHTLQGHIFLTTSGSSGQIPKWVALSKNAFLVSAKAVNKHLQSHSLDVWLNPLPEFHVGGLGILARAHLSGAGIIDFKQICPKWNPFQFHEAIQKHQVTLSALVPAQVFDLVTNHLQAPLTLRGIIVGGGALQEAVYARALELGWPLLPSYGLTECASQVATAAFNNRHLIPLEHVEAAIEDGWIKLKSPSLLTGYGIFAEGKWDFIDPKKEGWFVTEDRGILDQGLLKVLGREENFVKIGGESTNLQRLEKILEEIKFQYEIQDDLALAAVPDPRLGHSIHLVVTETDDGRIQPLIDEFQKSVLPFERIRKVHHVKEIPRSPLKKLIRQELLNLIG